MAVELAPTSGVCRIPAVRDRRGGAEYELIGKNPARGRRRRVKASRPAAVCLDRAEHILALLDAAGLDGDDRPTRTRRPGCWTPTSSVRTPRPGRPSSPLPKAHWRAHWRAPTSQPRKRPWLRAIWSLPTRSLTFDRDPPRTGDFLMSDVGSLDQGGSSSVPLVPRTRSPEAAGMGPRAIWTFHNGPAERNVSLPVPDASVSIAFEVPSAPGQYKCHEQCGNHLQPEHGLPR
jgi:hypothetical protein